MRVLRAAGNIAVPALLVLAGVGATHLTVPKEVVGQTGVITGAAVSGVDVVITGRDLRGVHSATIGGEQFLSVQSNQDGSVVTGLLRSALSQGSYALHLTMEATSDPAACSSIQPVSGWLCVAGGWVPPGHPAAQQTGSAEFVVSVTTAPELPALEYAQVYNVGARDILPGDAVPFTNSGPMTPGIHHVPGTPAIRVFTSGVYELHFMVTTNQPVQVGFFVNGSLAGSTAHGRTFSAPTPFSGHAILPLNSGDALTLQPIATSTSGLRLFQDTGGVGNITNASVVVRQLR
jgi:hypothetical protein